MPKANFTIDFEKRYNIACSQFQGPIRLYENVKIVGYTGAEVKESSGSLSKAYSHFSHWLVVERVDGRKVYLPMSSISVLEEADREKRQASAGDLAGCRLRSRPSAAGLGKCIHTLAGLPGGRQACFL